MHPFLAQLARTPLLCDGATGTELYAQGVPYDQSLDALNLTHPDATRAVHRRYAEAGADILETNTFGANRYKLADAGLADRVQEVNQSGVRLAQQAAEAAGRRVWIAGAVGPLGRRLAPLGWLNPSAARAAFAEQMAALAAAGADLLVLETMGDLAEIEQAIRAAREVCDLPVVAQMTFNPDGVTASGHTPAQVAAALAAWGVDVMGVNCGFGPARVLHMVQQLAGAAPGHAFSAQPNAGWPERVGDRTVYPATPDYFADYVPRLVASGVRIVGGCCGTTAEHIRAMRRALDAVAVGPARATPAAPEPVVVVTDRPVRPAERPTTLAQKLRQGEFVITVEMSPPKGVDAAAVLDHARLLQEAGADFINVADSPLARVRMSPWAVAHLLQARLGLESILHFPTRGRNLLRVQGDLLAAHALGIRNLFVVMGDPPNIGDHPEAFDHADVVPSGLIKLITAQFNQGQTPSGAAMGSATSFFVGAALNPAAEDMAREIKTLRKKVEAGASFALTMPLYDAAVLRRFVDALGGALPIPLLLGVLPLQNPRHARFLHNETPGITVPPALMERLEQAGDNSVAVGMQIADELIAALRDTIAGIYLMPPFGRYAGAAELIRRVRAAERVHSAV